MAECWYIPKFVERHTNAELNRKSSDTDWFWVKVPTSQDSLGLKRLMQTPEGREAFAVYMILVELAANGRPRGVLSTRSAPLSVVDIALLSSIPTAAIEAGITRLSNPDVDWIRRTEFAVGMPFPVDRESHSRCTENAIPPPLHHIAGGSGSNSDSPGGGAGGGSAVVMAMLQRAQVPDPADVLAACPGLTAACVVAGWADIAADRGVKQPGRVLAARLRKGQKAPALTTAAVLAAAKAGLVVSVGGTALNGTPLKRNAAGVYLGDSKQPLLTAKDGVIAEAVLA